MSPFLAVAPDKWLHFGYSFLLAWVNPTLAALAGIAKELWDMVSGGTPEWADLLADLLGILMAILLGA